VENYNGFPQQIPPWGVAQPPSTPPLRVIGTKRDFIFALLILLLSLLAVNFYLWGNCGIGAAVVSIALHFSGLLYIRTNRTKYSIYAMTCTLLYVLCAASFVFSDNFFGKLCTIAIMLLLSGTVIMEALQLRRWKAGTFLAIGDLCNTVFSYSFGSIGAVFYAFFHRKNESGEVQKRRVGGVLLGIACAIPALLIIVPLLSSADIAFEGLTSSLSLESSGEFFGTLLLGFALFLLFFGQHFAAKRSSRPQQEEVIRHNGLDPTAIIAFLSVISTVYMLYLFSQLAYFFSAFSGLLPKNFSVAQYARRGFFEMVTICLINLGLVVATLLTVRKKEDKVPLAVRLLSLFVCVFSLVLIATSISKMFLYIDSFGMTHLRILTSVFMVFLAVVFCVASITIFFRKVQYLKITLLTAAILVAVTGFADLDRVIAKYNVEAYLSGELDCIDMAELSILDSDSIVAYVWELRNDADPYVAQNTYLILYAKLESHDLATQYSYHSTPVLTKAHYDWRSFNLPNYESFCFLKEHSQEIIDGYCQYVIQ